jgi:hypothetical protein
VAAAAAAAAVSAAGAAAGPTPGIGRPSALGRAFAQDDDEGGDDMAAARLAQLLQRTSLRDTVPADMAPFDFAAPSPDDVVLAARAGRAAAAHGQPPCALCLCQ